ncbi:TauD/TfdA family dioxygenase [Nocardia sp. MW-W600-9]
MPVTIIDASGPQPSLPTVIECDGAEMPALPWLHANRVVVENYLHSSGAILLRGFHIDTAQFETIMDRLYGPLVAEHERSSPRHSVAPGVFTSTDHPADQTIFLHNEMSYSATWPMRIAFLCVRAPEVGGQTPIADTRRVLRAIPADVRSRFIERGVMYVRNYGDGFGLPWQTTFDTEDREVVERFCRDNGLIVEWKDRNRLRTRRIGAVVARHPVTGATVWFNHATFFHVSTLAPELRDALAAEMAPEDLPTNSFYADGSPIEDDILETVRAAYLDASTSFDWQVGDVLLLDNMLTAHGRSPFLGDRKIVVTMARPFTTTSAPA